MIKTYIEKRGDRVVKMQTIVDAVKSEGRAMTCDETNRFYHFEKEIQALDTAIEMGKGCEIR